MLATREGASHAPDAVVVVRPGSERVDHEAPHQGLAAKWSRRSAPTQILLLAGANFATMGMWNSLNGIGALGTGDAQMAAYCNVAAYLAGIFGGVIAGGAVNVIGVQRAALVGVAMQASSLVSYWLYYYRRWISLAAVTGYAFVWGMFVPWFTCATGTALVHYPTERERNRFISIVSIFLNIGGLIGGVISLVLNFDAHSAGGERRALTEPSYLVIITVSALGLVFAAFLVDYPQVLRTDRTAPLIEKKTVKGEVSNLVEGAGDLTLWCLVPLFLCVVWHEVVLFNFLNSTVSNVRTRAFNSGVYYVGRICASPIFHKVVDLGRDSLSTKLVLANVIIISFLSVGVLGIGPIFLGLSDIRNSDGVVDFTEPRAAFLVAAFLAYGGLETLCSNYVFWLIGVLPVGDGNVKNRYIGWSRSVTNLGGMLAWLLDSFDRIRPPIQFQWMLNLLLWTLALSGAACAYQRTTANAELGDLRHHREGALSGHKVLQWRRRQRHPPPSDDAHGSRTLADGGEKCAPAPAHSSRPASSCLSTGQPPPFGLLSPDI